LLAVFAGGLIVYGVQRVDIALKIGEDPKNISLLPLELEDDL